MLIASSAWLRILITFGVTLFLTPMLIGQLGLALFGVFMFVSLTMMMNNPLRAAVGKTLTRELTGAISAGDGRRTREVFTNGWCLAAGTAGVVVAVGLTLTVVAPMVFNFPPNQIGLVRLALLWETALAAEVFFLAPFKNLFLATHRHVQENMNRTIERTLDLVSAIVAFSIPGANPFAAFVVARAVSRSAFNVWKAVSIARLVPDARFTASMVSRDVMKRLAATGGWAMGNSLSRLGYYASDQVLLNLFFGPVYNGIYAIVNQLRAYTRMFGGNVTFGVESVSADLHERGRADSSRMLLLASMKFVFAITLFCGAMIAVFAGPLMHAWLGNRLQASAGQLGQVGLTVNGAVALAWTYVGIIIPGVVLAEMNVSAGNVLYGMGHEKRYAPALFAGAVGKIVLALALLFGGAGPLSLAWATLASQLLVFGVYFPFLIRRLTGISLRRQIIATYLRPILAVAPVAAAGLWMSLNLGPWQAAPGAGTINPQLLKVGACMAALGGVWAALAFLLVFDTHERNRVLGMAGPILRRVGLGRFVPAQAQRKKKGGKKKAAAEAAAAAAATVIDPATGEPALSAPDDDQTPPL